MSVIIVLLTVVLNSLMTKRGALCTVVPTVGKVWPKPQMEKRHNMSGEKATTFVLNPDQFTFQLGNSAARNCEILNKSLHRFFQRTFSGQRNVTKFGAKMEGSELKSLRILLMASASQCCPPYPQLRMDEQYELKIEARARDKATLVATTVWGILRGLESFSQLVHYNEKRKSFVINEILLLDFPYFTHRGILLDSSRHFLTKKVILENLDLMEMNKMNVFHWHISDDPSFPYQSKKFPKLSLLGSYNPKTHIYSQEDVKEIIEAARIRGIRVVPEFDTPGHTQSWEKGQPGLLARCGENDKLLGPVDPTLATTYTFLSRFMQEISQVFHDNFIHIGGDEVDFICWQNNKKIVHFMEKHNMNNSFEKLESMYIARLIRIIEKIKPKRKTIVWEEVFVNDRNLSKKSVVQVWKGGDDNWTEVFKKLVHDGYDVILSSPWYLNYITYGSDWHKFYNVKIDSNLTNAEQKHILGGEACMWGEFVNSVNLIPRLWPRASAVAERLWSNQVSDDATARIQEHECRMRQRGFNVEPANGPGFCPFI